MRPQAVLFDVFETLFNMDPIAVRLLRIGVGGRRLPLWFARTLRDAFALSAAGGYAPFRSLAGAALENLAAERGKHVTSDEIEWVLEGLSELPAHPDVAPAFDRLALEGVRIALLSNGSAENSWALVSRAGLERRVSAVFSTDEVRRFKPMREVYRNAVDSLELGPDQVALVAAHAWDVQGAKAAGLQAVFVRRKEPLYPRSMLPADARVDDLVEAVDALLVVPQPSLGTMSEPTLPY